MKNKEQTSRIPDSQWDFYSGLPNPLFYESTVDDRSDIIPNRTDSDMVSDQ